jgi:uncharacterized protein YdaU (DUF1376 family)
MSENIRHEFPWFQFFAGDWIASGTRMGFTYEEQGIYILLLAHCWRYPDCCLPDNRDRIARLCPGAHRSTVAAVLDIAFVRHPTCVGYTHPKLLTIRDSQKTRSESAQKSARKRWENRDANALLAQHCESNATQYGSGSGSDLTLCKDGVQGKPKRKRAPKADVPKTEYAPGVFLTEAEHASLADMLLGATVAAGLPTDAGTVPELLHFFSVKKATGYRSKAGNDAACFRSWVVRAYLEDVVAKLKLRREAQRLEQSTINGTGTAPPRNESIAERNQRFFRNKEIQ